MVFTTSPDTISITTTITPSPVLSLAPPPSPICSLGYRAAMIQLRAKAISTSHSLSLPPPFILSPTILDAPSSGITSPLPISVPTSSPPLLLPSASRREDKPEVTLPPRKRLGIALSPRYEVGESLSAAARPTGGLRADYSFVATMDKEIRRDPEREVRYGITDSWDEIVETLQGAQVSTDTELGRHMTTFETRVRQDTDEIYTRLDDEQSQRAHAYTRHLIETEARLSQEAWRRSMNVSDLARGEVMSLRTTVLGQMSEIRELHAADRRRQVMTSEMLKADHRRSVEIRIGDHTTEIGDSTIGTGYITTGTGMAMTATLQERVVLLTVVSVILVSHDVVYAMTWADLRKKMTDKYCPRNEMKKLEAELMFPEESDKIERYVGGLPDMIHGNIVASKPKTMQEAVEMATELMDKKVSTIAERQAENKRKFENTSQNNQNQQQQNKRQNTGRAYTAGTGEKKPYGGSKPLCAKCNYHHDCPCVPKCHKCNKFGHFARDCRSAE
ncbi:reverse transcriptase domain-containing protein [Tanacetum coccineum]